MLLRTDHIADSMIPSPAEWARALWTRHPLVLAPATTRGWFGGCSIAASDPVETFDALDLVDAGSQLQATFDGRGHALTVVLASYDGACTVVHYDDGFALAEDGWRESAGPAPPPRTTAHPSASPRCAPARSLIFGAQNDLTACEYRAGVRTVRERIAAGDVYVLNLTYRVTGRAALAPPEAFAALLDRAGSDFSAFLGLPSGDTVVSVSPERFVRVRDQRGARVVEIHPMKGTRPRGASPQDDAALARDLLGDAKERAEHVMVVDLERNDLGRVCVPGTVRVDPLYEVIPTPYCHQMVSTVKGELQGDVDFGEILSATFPCGSVTGAPKIAAMRIISEIEQSPRGAYCGALLVAVPGEMDSSVLIRTLEYSPDPGESAAPGADADAMPHEVRWGTGCGITIESDPAAEWLESLVKSSPVIGGGPPGVALLETCRIAFGRVPLLDRHLARLAAGGCGLSLLALVRARVASALGTVDRSQPYGRLRVLVDSEGLVEAVADTVPSSVAVADGPVLVTHTVRDTPNLPPGAAKPAARTFWDVAQAAVSAKGGHQAALVLADGTLVDGSTASIWVRCGRVLLTPTSPPAVDGVGRGVVLDTAEALGYRAEEAALTAYDLDDADEVFLSNALAGVVAVRGRGGAASASLATAFSSLWKPPVK